MASSVLEGSVIHTHGHVTSIFRVSKQKKKIKTFLANYRSFASIRLQKTQQQLSGHFSHTAGTHLLSSFNASLSL
jgi:hypothetical protein